MHPQFLSGKEFVYHAYVIAFIEVASQVTSSDWKVEVEHRADVVRLDLALSRVDEAVIKEHKRIPLLQDWSRSFTTRATRYGGWKWILAIVHDCRMKSPSFVNSVSHFLMRIARCRSFASLEASE